MGKVVPFGKNTQQRNATPKGAKPKAPATPSTAGSSGNTLCRNGHHRWVVWKDLPFDVRQGKLITVWRCERCGKQRSSAR